ncbi:MAG: sulfur carrier protein ThiS adenylyltransferase ThiF [Desulforhopalus sp.]
MNIGIAGAGGIGSNVAVNLVRSGITTIHLVDFDRVEPSNLNRQFYFADQVGRKKVDMLALNLQRINPELSLTTACTRITPNNIEDLFSCCDIIVEGLDGEADKKLLLESFCRNKSLVVSACGIAGDDLGRICTRKIGNSYVVGDFTSDCQDLPLFAHKVLTVAAKMSEIILQHGKQL